MKKILMSLLVAGMLSTSAFAAKQNGKQATLSKSKTASAKVTNTQKPVTKSETARPAETSKSGTVVEKGRTGSAFSQSPATAQPVTKNESKKASVKQPAATRSAAVSKSGQKN